MLEMYMYQIHTYSPVTITSINYVNYDHLGESSPEKDCLG